MNSSEINKRLELARQLAKSAGKATLAYFQKSDLRVERKGDRSPVTQADRECEQSLRKSIGQSFPEDGILGEEFGESPGSSGFQWILDPIDGTKSFISGVPLFGTMIAVVSDGVALAGVVYIAGLDELIYASHGKGCWHQRGEQPPQQAKVSSVDKLEEVRLVTSEASSFHDRQAFAAFDELESKVDFVRTWGDCYGYLLVATGRVDVMVDPVLNVWDAAAVQPIINEAGGRFTDWRGNSSISSGHSIGSNGLVHDQILQILTAQAQLD